MAGLPSRMNEPSNSDRERGVDNLERTKRDQNVKPPDSQEDLGETSDETGRKFKRDLRVEQTPGDDLVRNTPHVTGLGPGRGEGRVDAGFEGEPHFEDKE